MICLQLWSVLDVIKVTKVLWATLANNAEPGQATRSLNIVTLVPNN
jgi:hypothetical protein